MKRCIRGILLFLVLVVPLATTYLLLQVQKMQVKREIKKELITTNPESLVKLGFTKAEERAYLSWEHAKEFRYQGEMYDVVRTEVKGDTTYYWCWWDCEETKINKQLDELVSAALEDDPQKRQHESRLVKFLKSLYFSESPQLITFLTHKEHKYYLSRNEFYQFMFCRAPFSPPEFV